MECVLKVPCVHMPEVLGLGVRVELKNKKNLVCHYMALKKKIITCFFKAGCGRSSLTRLCEEN